tara:strand:- start:78 stop:347 length:270 start_codon:yes stop_codon:yes gene_type:complete
VTHHPVAPRTSYQIQSGLIQEIATNEEIRARVKISKSIIKAVDGERESTGSIMAAAKVGIKMVTPFVFQAENVETYETIPRIYRRSTRT